MAGSFVHLKASGSSEEPSPAGSKSDAEPETSQQKDEHKGRIQDGKLTRSGLLSHLRGVSAEFVPCRLVVHDMMALQAHGGQLDELCCSIMHNAWKAHCGHTRT
jgi:hypothetical protein